MNFELKTVIQNSKLIIHNFFPSASSVSSAVKIKWAAQKLLTAGHCLSRMPRMSRKNKKADQAESQTSGQKSAETKEMPGPPKSVWREYFESAIYTAIMFL